MDSTTDEKIVSVPYFVYESSQDRLERANKRLIIALVAAIIALLLTNAYWLYSWTRYDYMGEEYVSVDGRGGIASYIGNDGEINYAEDYDRATEVSAKEKWED